VTVRAEAPAASAAELERIISQAGPASERRQAIKDLAGTRSQEAELMLAQLLSAESEAVPIRTAAAAGLAYLATPGAVSALNAATSAHEPAIATAALLGVGRLGGEEAFSRASALAGEDSPVRRQAGFAANLIAYRLGKSERGIPLPDKSAFLEVSERAEAATVADASPELAAASLRWLREEEPPGIELSDEHVYELVCDLGSWIVLLNAEVLAAGATQVVQARKTVLGVLIQPLLDGPGFALGCYVLSQPAARARVDVLIARLIGGLAWAGSAVVEGGALRAHLRTVRDTPGLPVEADVALLDNGSIEFRRVLFDSSLRQGRKPGLTLASELPR
jgi:hypothetical protein